VKADARRPSFISAARFGVWHRTLWRLTPTKTRQWFSMAAKHGGSGIRAIVRAGCVAENNQTARQPDAYRGKKRKRLTSPAGMNIRAINASLSPRGAAPRFLRQLWLPA